MLTLAATRLVWKELRIQGILWLALMALSVVFAVAVVVLVTPDQMGSAFSALLFTGPALFGLASGAFAFAGEDEAETLGLLRRLPLTSREILRIKLGFGLAGLVLFFLVFSGVLVALVTQFRRLPVPQLNAPLFALWGLESLVWSALFSMRTRSTFAAAAWGAIAVASITLATEYSLAWGPLATWGIRGLVLTIAALRLVPQVDDWFHDYQRDADANWFGQAYAATTRLPRKAGRVLWLAYRENRWLILLCAVLVVALLAVGSLQSLYFRLDDIEDLARNDSWRQSRTIPFVAPLVPGFGTILTTIMFGSLLFAGLGLLVFGTVRQQRGFATLAQQGGSARFVAIVRIFLFGGLTILLYGLAGLAIARWLFRLDFSNSDGLVVIGLAGSIPLWCFVGAAWSSFHTRKKIIAYVAGLLLGAFAGSMQFLLAEPLSSVRIWGWWPFTWVGLALVIFTIVFAPAWALRRWPRPFRLAAWSIFPAALAAIYGGTAYYRTVDVPDISRMPLEIPVSPEIPDVKVVTAPEKIDLGELWGDTVPDYGTSAHSIWDRGDGTLSIYRQRLEKWLVLDAASTQWDAGNLNREQFLYRVFSELEPRIKWVRDKLISDDCLVAFSRTEQVNSMDWLTLGFYAKLKDSQPQEALRYIQALLKFSERHTLYRMRVPYVWGGLPYWATNQSAELDAYQMLETWVKHPSVSHNSELIRSAIDILPDPDEGRDMALQSIRRTLETRLKRESGYLRMPVDSQLLVVLDALRPWEVRRQRIQWEFLARMAVRSWNANSANEAFKIQRELSHYGWRLPHQMANRTWFEDRAERRREVRRVLEDALRAASELNY
jgi:hypothetical protein